MTIREGLEALGYDLSKTVGEVPILEIGLALASEIGSEGMEVTEKFCRPGYYTEAVNVTARRFRGWYSDCVSLFLETSQAKTKAGIDRDYGNVVEYLPVFIPEEERSQAV